MKSIIFTVFSLITTLMFLGVMFVYVDKQMEMTGQAISEEMLGDAITGGSAWEEEFVNETKEINEPQTAPLQEVKNEEFKTTQVQSAPSGCGCSGG